MVRHIRLVLLLLLLAGATPVTVARAATAQEPSEGALRLTNGTFCPLTRTDVTAEISGFLARVTVKQVFVNPTADRVEALYTFPLPQRAAVDDLTMMVGDRVVRGLIKRREEARRLYEQAREAGRTAALLEQERPNIFTQAVANIPPHTPVTIEISYLELVDYDAGRYAFVFPMVVGPRYIPGTPTGPAGTGWSPGTTRVPDASRITPPVAGVHVGKQGSRAGHDIGLSVRLDAGVPIQSISSPTHETDVDQASARSAVVRLRNQKDIPNRDFVLLYDTSGSRIEDALLAHAPRGEQGGYFGLILQPPDRVADEDVAPRELVFVLDTSGSMSGYPIETAKAVMRRAIRSLRVGDTFNLVTFAGDTRVLFDEPVQATMHNVELALAFLDGQRGGGGTEMMKAIRVALGERFGTSSCEPPDACGARAMRPSGAIRVVCFMTDGYVGDDIAIIGEVQRHPTARVFGFGIGSAVNRFLLEGMSRAGRGDVEFVLRHEDAEAAADRFYERINTPVLTDITIDWGALPVADLAPARIPDLFAARPLVIVGRYTKAASGTITLRGMRAGRPFSRTIMVQLPADAPGARAVAQLWAREQIETLSAGDWTGAQRGAMRPDLQEKIMQLGLKFRLMTAFTAFVAVEERTIVEGGQRRIIHVPVEMPANVSIEGVFGEARALQASKQAVASPVRVGGNVPPGAQGVVVGGVVGGLPMVPPPPPSTARPRAERVPGRDEADGAGTRAGREVAATPLASKLHVSLASRVECLEKAASSGKAASCGQDADGRLAVTVFLTVRPSAELLGRLQRAGLLVSASASAATSSGQVVTGRVTAAQLTTLAAMPEVRLIAAPSASTAAPRSARRP